jgi:site-specific recombinase XerD
MTMKDLRDRMIEDMKLRSLAPGTQRGYLDAVTALAAHYRCRPDRLSEQQIREYLLYLVETRKFAKSTFKIHLAALRFLYQRTLGRPWPVLQLPRVKTEKKLPVVLSREEVWSLLDQVRRPQARMSLILMYTCGLRVSEALHLRTQDIDSQRMVVWVRNGKGDKDRSVPLPRETLARLRAYWAEFRPQTWLFPSKTDADTICSGEVRRCLKAALWETAIRKKVGCHTLRHSYATHLLEAGVHLRAIQALLGHRSLKTTFIYMHLSQSTMAEVQAQINTVMRRR